MSERIGMLLAVLGIVVLAVFGVGSLIWALLFGDDLPIVVRIGIALVIVGVGTLLVVLIRDRLKARSEEDLEGIKP